MEQAPEVLRRTLHVKHGTERLFKEMVMPHLRESFEALMAVEADLFVAHPLTFAVSMAAEKRALPWASSVLAPISMFSAWDPSLLTPAPWALGIRRSGPRVYAAAQRFLQVFIRSWSSEVFKLRTELGLAPPHGNPLMEGQHSPFLVLALFSKALAAPQPDWPKQTVQTGYCFYDALTPGQGISAQLDDFLNSGEPPIVFTLGSSIVLDPGEFFAESAKAAASIGRRAVLLVGPGGASSLSGKLPEGVAVADYAPFGALFPRASAVVHQGGAGTTGQALRAGKPMLVVPFAHDQPDNALRVQRLGIGRALARKRYTARNAKRELTRLLEDPAYLSHAKAAAELVAKEDGPRAACDALECLLR